MRPYVERKEPLAKGASGIFAALFRGLPDASMTGTRPKFPRGREA